SCKVCSVLAVGLAVVGWWLVPNGNGDNLARLHYLAHHHRSKLRLLPLGNMDGFRSEMNRRDELVNLLPLIGRSLRAEEERWLTESLSAATSKAKPLRHTVPSRVLMVLKEALNDLPSPWKYMSIASPHQSGFRDAWQQAKQLRLDAAKNLVRSRITGNDYRAAAGIATELRIVAEKDHYRDEPLDT